MWRTVLPAELIGCFKDTICWWMVHHFTFFECENQNLLHFGFECTENIENTHWTQEKVNSKMSHIVRHQEWDVCLGASPVGWNNQATGISWLSWSQGMAEEGGLHSRIPVPCSAAYPCRMSPSCRMLDPVLRCILLQMHNPVKGTNVLQKSPCCPSWFLLTDIHL